VPPFPLILWHWMQESVSNSCAPRTESALRGAASSREFGMMSSNRHAVMKAGTQNRLMILICFR